MFTPNSVEECSQDLHDRDMLRAIGWPLFRFAPGVRRCASITMAAFFPRLGNHSLSLTAHHQVFGRVTHPGLQASCQVAIRRGEAKAVGESAKDHREFGEFGVQKGDAQP